jgi:hypothetical protein
MPPGGGSNLSAPAGNALGATAANNALAYDVSNSLTTVYISIAGYQGT